MNILLAADQHVVTEIQEARDDATRAIEEAVNAYRRVAELEALQALREAFGARVTLATDATDVVPLRKEG